MLRSQIWITLSSQDTTFVAVGENSQYRTQLLCCFKVYWRRLSTVDQILTNLSSPQEARRRPSQENPTPRILALWALINVTSLAVVSKSTYQNLRDSSLLAETRRDPLGLNLRLLIWFWMKKWLLYVQVVYEVGTAWWGPIKGWHYPFQLMLRTCRWDADQLTWWTLYVLSVNGLSRDPIRYACSNFKL